MEQQRPLTLAVGQSEGVAAQRVGQGIAAHRLTAPVVERGPEPDTTNSLSLLGGMQLAIEIQAVLYRVAAGETLRAVHLAYVIPAPALNHHQQVGCTAVNGIVGLEIVVGIVDVAAKVGRQQQPCGSVARSAVNV